MPFAGVIGGRPPRRPIPEEANHRAKRLALRPVAANIAVRKDHQVEYNTSATDVAFIGLCRKAYGRIAGMSRLRLAA